MLIRFILGEEANGRFPATVRIESPGMQSKEKRGYLPAIPSSLKEMFMGWRAVYFKSEIPSQTRFRDLSILLDSEEDQARTGNRITPIDTRIGENPTESVRRLKRAMNDWLSSGGGDWLNVRDVLTDGANQPANNNETIRVFLEFEDPWLRRLPWQVWDVFEKPRYRKSGIAFATLNGDLQPRKQHHSVRILVVVGNNKDIEQGTQNDVETTESLKDVGAEVTVLRQPSSIELIEALKRQSYEVFIFTGHSWSEEGTVGWLELNNNEDKSTARITIDQLRENLHRVVENGLQLCVFNSCDGLGLSKEFTEDLKLPVAIVMREPVPDKVAVSFLQSFFEYFAHRGYTFFDAFQEARLALESFTQYPGVIWLPAIYTSSWTEPPTWQQLRGSVNTEQHESSKPSINWQKWVLPGGLAVTAGIVGLIFLINRSQPSNQPSNNQALVAIKPPSAPNNKPWRYGGSRSLVPLKQAVEPLIQQSFPSFKLENYQANGTEKGIKKLQEGQIDFILASDQDDPNGLLEYKPIAKDAIVFVVNPKLELPRGLTLDEIKDIYRGKVTNWSKVGGGGPDLPIKANYRSGDESGTTRYFKREILKNDEFGHDTILRYGGETSAPTKILNKIASTEGAIYFGTASEVLGQCTVKPIAIGKTVNELVLPYAGNIATDERCPNKPVNQLNIDAINQNKYPIIRYVYVGFIRNQSEASKAGKAFANIVLTNEGQSCIKNAGYAPLH